MEGLKVKRKSEPSAEAKRFIASLEKLQKSLEGEAEKAGLDTEEKIIAYCKEIRRELVY